MSNSGNWASVAAQSGTPQGERLYRNLLPRANAPRAARFDHALMTKPHTSRKVLLMLQQRGPGETGGAQIRRYRLARLRFDERAVSDGARFEHLKRVYE